MCIGNTKKDLVVGPRNKLHNSKLLADNCIIAAAPKKWLSLPSPFQKSLSDMEMDHIVYIVLVLMYVAMFLMKQHEKLTRWQCGLWLKY
jgi:5-methylcytosine-specific restriction endonuclease McrA